MPGDTNMPPDKARELFASMKELADGVVIFTPVAGQSTPVLEEPMVLSVKRTERSERDTLVIHRGKVRENVDTEIGFRAFGKIGEDGVVTDLQHLSFDLVNKA